MKPKATTGKTPRGAPHVLVAEHPRSVPNVAPATDDAPEFEQPFEEGAHDALDPDLRHRLISEAAYALYARRGYVDGYDVDDWLDAEGEVDHLLVGRIGGAA